MLCQSNYLAAPTNPPPPSSFRFCEILMRMRPQGVTPEKVPQKFSNFWRKDVKAHRNYYRSKEMKLMKEEAKAFGLGYL
jgi:hypothetical protein